MPWEWFINLLLLLAVFSSSLTQQTADTLANSKTKQLLAYIAGLPQQGKFLSGQFAGFNPDTFNTSIINQISQQVGQVPAILGCDWACGWDYMTPPSNIINYSCNPSLKTHWNLGGLVTIEMHLPNPDSPNGGGYNTVGNLTFSDLTNNVTATGQRWRTFLDRMALGLDDLQQSGVTVLFRPFHEMNGNWFYWGSQNPQTFISVWIDMFNYLTNTKNIHNVLWVYAPDQSRGNRTAYYPGSAYVDIVALDVYVDNPNTMNGYNEMISLNKPFALGEVGPATTNGQFDYTLWLTAIAKNFSKISYYLAWNDAWAPIANKNAYAFYNNAQTINRGGIVLNNSLITTTTSSSSSSSSVVIYNFSNGVGQWNGSNVIGGPWVSNEFTFASTDSLKCDIDLYAGSAYYIYTDQASTFTFSNYQKLFAQARFASWGFQSGGTMTGKLYIKAGSSYTWYDSGAVQLTNNTATQLVLNLSSIPSSALANIKEVGVQYLSSSNGSQTSIYVAYITASN